MSLLGPLWRPRLRLLIGRYTAAESIFRLHDHAHGVKIRLQIFKFTLVLELELLDSLIELMLRTADLLRKPIGTVLQVTANVTHRLFPDFSSTRPKNNPQRSSSAPLFAAMNYETSVPFEQRFAWPLTA
jgi:hypothetical protein